VQELRPPVAGALRSYEPTENFESEDALYEPTQSHHLHNPHDGRLYDDGAVLLDLLRIVRFFYRQILRGLKDPHQN
jgi:hypothetical protein